MCARHSACIKPSRSGIRQQRQSETPTAGSLLLQLPQPPLARKLAFEASYDAFSMM
jgi:hypothetical protein